MRVLQSATSLTDVKIVEVLKAKPSPAVITIGPDATVRELLELLAEHGIGAAIVTSDGTTMDGIVSERDVVRAFTSDDDLLARNVDSIMTRSVVTCDPDSHVDEIRNLMTTSRFRHIPVVADGELRGIVSIGDIVKAYINQVEFERDQLDSYLRQAP